MLEAVPFTHGDVALTGRLARPAGPARGAIVLFPTIANATPAMERRADMLADAGFVTMIADFYGVQPASFEAAQPLAAALRENVTHYRQRLLANVEALHGHDAARGLALGMIGYCMGGQAMLEVACSGADLAMGASFHGILSTGMAADKPIVPRLLICHGDADPMVPREQVLAFWREMDAVGAQWHFHSYSGVKHGFSDPGSDARGLPAIAYDARADAASWAALMQLCDEVFGQAFDQRGL